MKLKNLIFTLVLLFLPICSGADAADDEMFMGSEFTDNVRYVTIYGKTAVPNKNIAIEILRPEKAAEGNENKDTAKEEIMFLITVTSDFEGIFSQTIVFDKNEVQGDYRVTVNADSSQTFTYHLYDDSELNTAFNVITSSYNIEEIVSAFERYGFYIGVDTDEFLKLSDKGKTEAAELFLKMRNQIPSSDISLDKLNDILGEAQLIAKIKCGAPEDAFNIIYENKDALGIFNTSVFEFAKLTDEELKQAYKIMVEYNKDKLYSYASVREQSDISILLYTISRNGIWYDTKSTIEKYSELLGVDLTLMSNSDSSEVYKLVKGKPVYTKELLKEYFENAVTEVKNKPTSYVTSGSGKTGSGSTLGSISFNPIESETTKSDRENQPDSVDKTNNFSDIDGVSWAKEAIEGLASLGILSGTGEGKFSPNESVKREEIAKLFVLAGGFLHTDKTSDYIDVNNTMWYAEYICSAKKNGLLGGYGDGRFGVGDYMTREELAVAVYRFLQLKGIEFGTSEDNVFTDEISDWALEAVCGIYSKNIISGHGDGTFAARDFVTRAEAAKIVYNTLKQL